MLSMTQKAKFKWAIVGIKRLLDDLRVTAAQLMLLVYKLLLLVLKVNADSTKVTTAQRLRLLKEFLSVRKEKDIIKDKDCFEIKITYDKYMISIE
ncbi:hypothetical protein Tco_0712636 [Tanacetum coccineum]